MGNNFTNRFILESLGLPIITDLDSLSDTLGLSKRVIYLLTLKNDKYYRNNPIKKRDGSLRDVVKPSYSMKLIQRWLLKEVLEKIKTTDESMAFKKGTSGGIIKNAEAHRYSMYILQLDIQDFFPSIDRARVFFVFKNIGYNDFVSNVFANMCTYKGTLPQGAVTSPYISNLVCYRLDKRLKGLCNKYDTNYTRYADDLTFSCDNKQTLRMLRKRIEFIIECEGFKLNHNKTRFLSPGSKMSITGITINDKRLNANKELKKKVRAMIHNAIMNGDYGNNDKIRGYIAHINFIEEGYRKNIINYINKIGQKITYDNQLVNKFNDNRLYKEVPLLSYDPDEYDPEDYPLDDSNIDDIF